MNRRVRIGFLDTENNQQCLSGYDALMKCPKENPSQDDRPFGFIAFLLNLIKIRDVEFVKFSEFSPDNWTTVDNGTLLGALKLGTIDTTIYGMVVTEQRAQHISFAIPDIYDRLCFFSHAGASVRPSEDFLYFLSPFTKDTWVAHFIFGALFVGIYWAVRPLRKKFRIGNYHLKLQNTLFMAFVTFSTFIYDANLRAIFTGAGQAPLPFRTMAELARKIRLRSAKLM